MLMGPFRCVAQTAGILNTKASMSWKVTKKTNGATFGRRAGVFTILRTLLTNLHQAYRLELLAGIYFTALTAHSIMTTGEVKNPVAHCLALAPAALSSVGFVWLAYGDLYL